MIRNRYIYELTDEFSFKFLQETCLKYTYSKKKKNVYAEFLLHQF